MMVRIFHIVCLVLPFISLGQTKLFNERLSPHLSKKEVFEAIPSIAMSEEEFCPINGDYERLEAIALDWMKKNSRNKRFELQKSSFLHQVSLISVNVWANSYFYTKRELIVPKRQIKRALPKTTTKYGLIDCFSFAIPLIEPVKKKKLKYDYKGPTGELNLFLRKKTKDEEGKKAVEYIPVTLRSESDIAKNIIHELKKKGVYKSLRSGLYYSSGITVKLDQRTVGKSRIPHAKVFVVMGAKRLHFIKEKG